MTKPVLLFFFANDVEDFGSNLRELAKEARCIEQAMESGSAPEMCEIEIVKNTSGEDIRRKLDDYAHRVSIVHYAGHAESLRLMLESDEGGKEEFRVETLAAYLKEQQGLELVFLNGCSTDDQVESLLDAGVPYVIATNQAIDDSVATNLSMVFYEGIAKGRSIDVSWNNAKASTKQKVLSSPRGAYFEGVVEKVPELSKQFPWELRHRQGINPIPKWNLPEASNNPLLGMPELPDTVYFPGKPFRKLHRFTRDDARVFFGRGNEVRALYNYVMAPKGSPVILYYGQSGVGKSSLLEAGLLPRLEGHCDVRYIRRSSRGAVHDVLAAFDLTTDARDQELLRERWIAEENDKPQVIILDQLEEAFSHRAADEAANEIAELASLLGKVYRNSNGRPKGKIIIAFRKEWRPEIDAAMEVENIPRSDLFLRRLTRQGVCRAIMMSEEAREHYRLTFENDELAETIAADLMMDKDSPLAPTLQILLATMWQYARDVSGEPEFTDQLFSQLRHQGIQMGDFLTAQISEVAAKFPKATQDGLLLSLLGYHCSRLGTAVQRTEKERAAYFRPIAGEIERLAACCKKYLLLTDASDDARSSHSATRLGHDTLAPLVRQKIHDSTAVNQRADRILRLRTQAIEGAEGVDLLTRREFKTVRESVDSMRQLTSKETQLVEDSKKAFRKKNRFTGALALLIVLIAAGVWWSVSSSLYRAEVKRLADLMKTGDSKIIVNRIEEFTDSPGTTMSAIEDLYPQDELEKQDSESWDDRQNLVSTIRESPEKIRKDINVSLVKSFLGDCQCEELVAHLTLAAPDDIASFKRALLQIESHDNHVHADALSPLAVFAEKESSWPAGKQIQMRARLVWICLLLNRHEDIPESWYLPSQDQESRSLLTVALADWFINDPDYRAVFGAPDSTEPSRDLPADLLAILCQSVFFLPDTILDEGLKNELATKMKRRLNHRRITVRSSARAALTRLGHLSSLHDQTETLRGDDWFAIGFKSPSGAMQMLDFARVKGPDGKEFWLATTETPWTLVEQHLSKKRLDVRNNRLKNVIRLEDEDMGEYEPARFVVWADALEFCNKWTENHMGFPPEKVAYTENRLLAEARDDGGSTLAAHGAWAQNPDGIKHGFRLPTSKEWQIAAAAGSDLEFSYGASKHLMQHFGWTAETSEGVAHPYARRLPNAYGFFDMHGNLQEWCWPSFGNDTANNSSDLVLSAIPGELSAIAGAMAQREAMKEQRKFIHNKTDVAARDGSYMQRRKKSGLPRISSTIGNSDREWFLGFRVAVTEPPQINTKEGE